MPAQGATRTTPEPCPASQPAEVPEPSPGPARTVPDEPSAKTREFHPSQQGPEPPFLNLHQNPPQTKTGIPSGSPPKSPTNTCGAECAGDKAVTNLATLPWRTRAGVKLVLCPARPSRKQDTCAGRGGGTTACAEPLTLPSFEAAFGIPSRPARLLPCVPSSAL